MIDEAIDLINNEDYNSAQRLLEKVINEDNKNIEAYKNLGLCLINSDNPTQALDAFKKAVELDETDATSVFYLANCYNRVGEKELAIENFEKVIELRKNYLDAYKSLAMIYIEFARIDEAISLVESAIENPEIEMDCSTYNIIATAYMIKKDFSNAIKYFSEALKINPENVQILNSYAISNMNIGEFEKAIEALDKALEIEPENSLTNYNLGIINQVIGNHLKALEYFKESYRIEPSITMLATLANAALNANDAELAKTLYSNLVMAYPNNSKYRTSYVEALELTGDYSQGLENVNQLLTFDEKNISLIKKKGAFLRKLGKHEESIATFQTLLNRGKIDVEVYYNLAFNYVETQDYDNAKEMFKKCIILEPQNPYAHKDLGVLYLKMNLYDWAVDEMEEAIKLEDDVAEFYYSLGVAYLMLSRVDDSKKALLKAIELEPNNPDTLSYLGYIYLTERDFDKAYEYLEKSIKIAPDSFLSKINMAKYYFQLKKYDVAKELLIDCVEKTKDDETMNMLAICYLEEKDYESAMGLFSKLIVNYPKNHILLTNLARCEFECNKKDKAQEHLRQALMIFDDYKEALDLLKEINCGK